jgi:hypothetical protein
MSGRQREAETLQVLLVQCYQDWGSTEDLLGKGAEQAVSDEISSQAKYCGESEAELRSLSLHARRAGRGLRHHYCHGRQRSR